VRRNNAAAADDGPIGRLSPSETVFLFLLKRRTLQEARRLG
jgi:hypothetical protein